VTKFDCAGIEAAAAKPACLLSLGKAAAAATAVKAGLEAMAAAAAAAATTAAPASRMLAGVPTDAEFTMYGMAALGGQYLKTPECKPKADQAGVDIGAACAAECGGAVPMAVSTLLNITDTTVTPTPTEAPAARLLNSHISASLLAAGCPMVKCMSESTADKPCGKAMRSIVGVAMAKGASDMCAAYYAGTTTAAAEAGTTTAAPAGTTTAAADDDDTAEPDSAATTAFLGMAALLATRL